MDDVDEAKRRMRARLRAVRRDLPDRAERADRIWAHVRALPSVAAAGRIMAFEAIPGEPDASAFVAWCRAEGKAVVVADPRPDAEPPGAPGTIDVVVVPGVAFTARGDRLGQGGGWYDRFLATTATGCTTVGVAFAPQLVPALPTGPHDRRVDVVVTDLGIAGAVDPGRG
jgi:5-formyltetrahydrofolate cyclo-ligase